MKTLKTVSVVEAVAQQIREDIFEGAFRPGDALVEIQLAERYGVPRPTLRSALVTLVHDGLLRREPNKSVYVPRLTEDDLLDLFSVRKLIETEATRRVMASGADLRELERAVRVIETFGETDGWEEMLRFDFQFHRTLVDAAGSDRLRRLYSSIASEMRLALSYFRSPHSGRETFATEHRELLDLIQAGDVAAAVEACRVHIEESERFINSQLQMAEQTETQPLAGSEE